MTADDLDDRIRRAARVGHSRAGGPGGQNVNKVNTRITLHVPLQTLGLEESDEVRVRERLATRINGAGELVVHAAATRSQHRNLELAYQRARELLTEAMAEEPPARKPSRPRKAARERRLTEKRIRAHIKNLRQPPGVE